MLVSAIAWYESMCLVEFFKLCDCAAANLALGGYMVKGYTSTKKPFPQGVFSVVSAINSVIYIRSLSSQI